MLPSSRADSKTLVHLLDKPDSVILLGDKFPGHVLQGSLDELKASTGIQSLISSSNEEGEPREETGQETPLFEAVSRVPRKTDEVDSKVRSSGDFSLYLYYFKAVGPKNLAIVLVSELGNAIMNIFPGTTSTSPYNGA